MDDNSVAPTPGRIVEFADLLDLPLVYVSNAPERGAASARNRGAAAASGDILGFLDDDSVPRADWLREVRDGLEDPTHDAITGRILPLDDRSVFSRARQLRYDQRQYEAESGAAVRFLAGGNCAIGRHDFEDCGGFDPSFVMMHDRELAWRLAQRGRRCVYVKGLTIFHNHHKGVGVACRQSLRAAQYRLRMEQQYPESGRLSLVGYRRSVSELWRFVKPDGRRLLPFAVAVGLESLHGCGYLWYLWSRETRGRVSAS